MRKIEIRCMIVSLWAIPMLAQPPATQAVKPPPEPVCERAFGFEFGLRIASTEFLGSGGVVGVPVQIRASQPTLVITVLKPKGRDCVPVGQLREPQKNFVWRMIVPAGSHSQLDNTTGTLLVSFTPDKTGLYTLSLDACGNGCTIGGVPVGIDDPGKEQSIVINVVAQAQARPDLVPPPHPSPQGEPPTAPQAYTEAVNFCDPHLLIGLGLTPEWFTTDINETAARRLELAEGRVYESGVSRIDTPRGHLDNDVDVVFDVDPWKHKLIIRNIEHTSQPIDIGKSVGGFRLDEGALKAEWEWPEWDEGFRPLIGDRISVLGYHVIDCGHEINTEIHPPVAVAVHRPLPVRLPEVGQLEQGKPPAPIGTNVVVPGIVTDIWVHLRGGDALECLGDSLRQSRVVKVTVGGQTFERVECVPQPNLPDLPGQFTFHVYLPVNPLIRIRKVMKGDPPVPALFTLTVNHPETPAGARTDLALQIDPSHATGIEDQPYLTVTIDISKMRGGESFAKRLISAWVYPDLSGTNFGLQASRVRLTELRVIDDGDELPGNSGDWRLWVGYPNAQRPWTRLIINSVDEKTYSPTDSVFVPGALDFRGALKGDFLRFTDFGSETTGRLRLTGYEQDTFGSDDVGEVTDDLPAPGQTLPPFKSFCVPENETITDKIVNSGCAAYTARFAVEPSQAPTQARLSREAEAFLNKLLIGEPSLNLIPPITDSGLFAGPVTAAILPFTSHREVEPERWQETFKPGKLVDGLARSKSPDAFMKDIRRHVENVLGTNPTPQLRAKVAADLRKLKPSIPAALYQRYWCELETGRPCTGAP